MFTRPSSKLSWDRLLSFCRLNLSFKLFPLCSSNVSIALQLSVEWWFHQNHIFVGTEYSESGICIAMNECAVIMDCCQSSYDCFTNFARVAMVTIKNARAGSLLFSCFSDVIFPLLSCTICQTPEA